MLAPERFRMIEPRCRRKNLPNAHCGSAWRPAICDGHFLLPSSTAPVLLRCAHSYRVGSKKIDISALSCRVGAMETHWATEHLQVIRTLMERSAVYRRGLAPLLVLAGGGGVAGAFGGWVGERGAV